VPRIYKVLGIAASFSALACSDASDAGNVSGPTAKAPTPPTNPPVVVTASGQIAFVSRSGQLAVMNADGSDVRTLTAGRGSDPAWSPDGATLAFASDSGIYLMNADGTRVAQLTHGGTEPTWSPDGSRIAFTMSQWDSTGVAPTLSRRIAVVNVDGSGLTWLSAGPYDDSPAWSPDGIQIAFVRSFDDYLTPSTIYVVSAAAASLPVARTYLPHGDPCGDESGPAWTPDGKSLLFWTVCPGGPNSHGDGYGFALGNADGSGTTTPIVTDVAETYYSKPAWSPDGKWIAFGSPGVEGDGVGSTIYVMSGHGSKAAALAQGSKPAWRPAR